MGGGLTFVTFKPCCMRLKGALSDTLLSNPEHFSSVEEDETVHRIITGEFTAYDEEEEIGDEGKTIVEHTENNIE